jgi:hypothetical protein
VLSSVLDRMLLIVEFVLALAFETIPVLVERRMMRVILWCFKRRGKGRHKRRYCPRYYVRATKRRGSRIGTKIDLGWRACYFVHVTDFIRKVDERTAKASRRKHRASKASRSSDQDDAPPLGPWPPDDAAPRMVSFDTHSYPIRLDTHSSYSSTPFKSDFVGEMVPIKAHVTGAGNHRTEVQYSGTVQWFWDDDDGHRTVHVIPDTLYMPSNTERILAIHHWSQARKKETKDAAYAKAGADSTVIFWNHDASRRTVPVHPISNVSILQSSPMFSQDFAQYNQVAASEPEVEDWRLPPLFQRNVVSDDDDSDEEDGVTTASEGGPLPLGPRPVAFGTGGVPATDVPQDTTDIEDELSPRQLYLHWHHRLGHIGPRRLLNMVRRRLLPAKIAQARPPKCAACMIGKATRRPWRTKATPNKMSIPVVNHPGDCVSVDQLQSTTPGLLGQMRGFLTKRRLHFATIFVDHKTSLSFVHLSESCNAEDTIEAKDAFESYARSRGVIVKHYHCDNGRFAEKAWTDHCKSSGQTVSFCGVNAHHANGVAEKRIRDLQEATRAVLIHAKRRWPAAIDTHLWPYALRAVNHSHNCVLSAKTDKVPLLDFSQVGEPVINYNHLHTFGCPAYALDDELAQGKRRSRHVWSDRARMAIYIGPSPQHGSSIGLLLNLTTGHVSPSFHAEYDDHFDTTRPESEVKLPLPLWQTKTYFTETSEETAAHTNRSESRRASTTADTLNN